MFFKLNREFITRRAKRDMIDIHSQKVLKAWLDMNLTREKLESLKAEYEAFSPEIRDRVEKFVTRRNQNPEKSVNPSDDIAQALTTKIGIDSLENALSHSLNEYNTFCRVIDELKQVDIPLFS